MMLLEQLGITWLLSDTSEWELVEDSDEGLDEECSILLFFFPFLLIFCLRSFVETERSDEVLDEDETCFPLGLREILWEILWESLQ